MGDFISSTNALSLSSPPWRGQGWVVLLAPKPTPSPSEEGNKNQASGFLP